MKKIILLMILLTPHLAHALEITEIMYNPNQCSDRVCEWIEIVNNQTQSINISDITLCNDQVLEGYIQNNTIFKKNITAIKPNQFAIITDGGSGTEVFSQFNVSKNAIYQT
jgi:hypothetical protein